MTTNCLLQDELKEVILCFSRDRWVRLNCAYEVHKPIFDLNEQLQDSEGCEDEMSHEAAPPCGPQPFLGLASYFAPLGVHPNLRYQMAPTNLKSEFEPIQLRI